MSWIRRSPQRRERFLDLTYGKLTEEELLEFGQALWNLRDLGGLMVKQDNDSRWNSLLASAERAMKLKDPIEVFQRRAPHFAEVAASLYYLLDHFREKKKVYADGLVNQEITCPEYAGRSIFTGDEVPALQPTTSLESQSQRPRREKRLPERYGGCSTKLPGTIRATIMCESGDSEDPTFSDNKNLRALRASLSTAIFKIEKYIATLDHLPAYWAAMILHPGLKKRWIGKRVYWPGTGPGIRGYHLLHVGNNAGFSYRAHVVTSDAIGSEHVTIGDGAMIAYVLLPSITISKETTMGSGALTRRSGSYSTRGACIGSKGGDAMCLSTGRQKSSGQKGLHRRLSGAQGQWVASCDTLVGTSGSLRDQQQTIATGQHIYKAPEPASHNLSPFGRAFYLKQAPFRVLGPFAIFSYTSFATLSTAFFWNIPNDVAAIQTVDHIYRKRLDEMDSTHDMLVIWDMVTLCIAILTTLQSLLAIGIVVAAKWILLGRRVPGNYDWDRSSYCQRWQLFLTIEKLRHHCYRGQGILGLLTGTEWIVRYFRPLGATIGKDSVLFANGRPSLMFTEPDH